MHGWQLLNGIHQRLNLGFGWIIWSSWTGTFRETPMVLGDADADIVLLIPIDRGVEVGQTEALERIKEEK